MSYTGSCQYADLPTVEAFRGFCEALAREFGVDGIDAFVSFRASPPFFITPFGSFFHELGGGCEASG